jgi:predicted DNA-binding transcriptional regulator AlpA
MPESWVSVENVASHLGVAKDSVYRWIEYKGLPAHLGWAALEIQAVRGGPMD